MTEKKVKENKSPSLQNARKILVKAFDLITKDAKNYYLKNASEISEKSLKEVDKNLVLVSDLLRRFFSVWIDSKTSGPDAIVVSKQLEDRIDIKLLETGRLDFKQMKRIMVRLHTADDVTGVLDKIEFYIHYYKTLCHRKNLKKQEEHVEIFINHLLNRTKTGINWDTERLTNQLRRCNLYYQNTQAESSQILQKSAKSLTKMSIVIATAALIASIVIGASSIYVASLDYQRTHPDGVYYVHVDFLGYDEPANSDHFRISITYYGTGESRFLRISVGIVGANPTVVSKGNVEVMDPNIILARNYVDGLIGWVDYNIQRFASLNRTRLNILDFDSDVSVSIIDDT